MSEYAHEWWHTWLIVGLLFSTGGAWNILKDHDQRLERLEGIAPTTTASR